MTKKNILSNKKHCYGCGVCEIICPKKIISIKLDADGFYFPTIIDDGACIECGQCMAICAYDKELSINKNNDIKGYAAWSNNEYIRNISSSGGVAYEMLSSAIDKDFKACIVKYNINKNIAEHYIATQKEELLSSLGSKYIQSYTVEAFRKINIKDKNVVVGTPCQIHSLREYIKRKKCEDNFILIDFFCHGVPSMKMWNKYLNEKKNQFTQISNIIWREKSTGWHDSWGIKVESNNGTNISKWSKGDLFYKLFLGHFCLGKSCHNNCKYKMFQSAADVRLGDLWGKTYAKDDKGVSAILCFTNKGKKLIEESNLNKTELSKEIVAEGQMKNNAKPAYMRTFAMFLIKHPFFSINSLKVPIFIETLFRFPKRIIKKMVFK